MTACQAFLRAGLSDSATSAEERKKQLSLAVGEASGAAEKDASIKPISEALARLNGLAEKKEYAAFDVLDTAIATDTTAVVSGCRDAGLSP